MRFKELNRLEDLVQKYAEELNPKVEAEVHYKGQKFPLYSFTIGSKAPEAPTLGLFAGIHGLERIGTKILLSFFETFLEQSKWDEDLAQNIDNCRVVSMPLINPVGMAMGWRSNGNGVDLMRNSPIEAEEPAFLLGGHRIGNWMFWYRGKHGEGMELESKTLVDVVKREMFSSQFSFSLDVHSGFGMRDRLWFPYAKSRKSFPWIHKTQLFKELIDRTWPHNVFKIEPQSLAYMTHGDIWDYLLEEHINHHQGVSPVYIPWTLEIGSWTWIRKNPIQAFSLQGPFNPIKKHRYERAIRRHRPLVEFFLKAVKNYRNWALEDE